MNIDTWTKRLIVANVSVLGILAVIGSIYLQNPPEWFSALAFASLTGLLGYLAPSPVNNV